MPPQVEQACKTLVYSQVITAIWLWALQDTKGLGDDLPKREAARVDRWNKSRRKWESGDDIYGIVLYGEALEGSFLFLDSMCTEPSPCFPYSKGGGLKKPSEIIYIHIQKAKRNHSSSWLSPGLSLYFTVTSQHVHKTITLGVDNYIGSELCTLA